MRRAKLVCEDLSPILKENQNGNCAGKFTLKNKFRNQTGEESDETKDLTTRLNVVNLESDDTDDYQTACSDTEVLDKKDMPKKKKNDRKSTQSTIWDRPLQKENRSPSRIGKPKVNKTKEITKKKKKDSFIVSDDSTISNDSMTIYHKVLSKDIRTDVRKLTPRNRLRKSISTNDDGIFTPYIWGKRGSSDSSFTDEEKEIDDNPKNSKFPKSQLFLNTGEKKSPVESSEKRRSSVKEMSDSNDDSRNLFATIQPKPKSRAPLDSAPTSKVPSSKNFLKDISWILTDDESSDDAKWMIDEDSDTVPSIDSKKGGDKLKTPPRKKFPSKKKSRESGGRDSLTPITFLLKNVKNLTPKVDEYEKEKTLSFLMSLSIFNSPRKFHPDAEKYKKKFKKTREELTAKLFKMFNEEVFTNQLPTDLKIEWNARLRSSSGLCYNRRVKTIITANLECLRTSRIALSTKIIETPDRLRDTLIHEMCHAAAWIIDNQSDGHGPRWRAWADKAMKTFPELPMIKRCHNYSVKTKYSYKCVKCGYTIGRHSKSLNTERKRCGYCYGKFELIVNNGKLAKADTSRTKSSPKNVQAKPLSKFALFVKENYGKIKSEQPKLKHGEIMKELSKNFASTKISNA